MRQYDDAEAAYKSAQAIGKSDAFGYRARLARMYARAGRREEALRIVERLKTVAVPAGPLALYMASAYAALGNSDEAFTLLRQTIEQHDSLTVFIKEDPPFKGLHSDPRWKDLLRKMNFPTD
jgi:tetratricopeptide (TPR) repeat protein